jgi:peptidoglycan/LPS O-acetylase OafA/YrhL
MLQRVQTIYLLIASIALLLTIWLPFAGFQFGETTVVFSIFGVSSSAATLEEISSWIPYYLVIGLSLGLMLFSISQYKNRKRQLNLGKINYLLLLLIIVLLFLDAESIGEKLKIERIEYGLGMYLPVIALAFTFLANRSIKKDEDLVKSVDRLRSK